MEKATKKKWAKILLAGSWAALAFTVFWGAYSIFADVPTGEFIEISRWWDVLAAAVFVIISLSVLIFLFPVACQEFEQEVEFPEKVGMLGLAFGSIFGPIIGLFLGLKFSMTWAVIGVIAGIIGVTLAGFALGLVVWGLWFVVRALGAIFYLIFYFCLFKGIIMPYIRCHKWAFGKEKKKETKKKTKKK